MWDSVPGMAGPMPPARCCTPGRPAPETVALRRQLEAMRDGGIYAIVDSASALPLPARPV